MSKSLTERLLSRTTIKQTAMITESKILGGRGYVQTAIPMLNIALSGSPTGGLESGLGILAGPSRHFKSSFALIMVAAYLKKHPDAVCLFYDSEFGTPGAYFASSGVDVDRVVHCPISNIEELKFDVMQQLDEIKREDNIIIVVDSIGNLASKKEVEDAMNEKSVADMTRAKQLKSLFRMVTPHLTTKDIPMVCINHTYETMELYAKTMMSGGTGPYYSANWIFIIGRSQEKDGTELTGYKFTINVEKSRKVRERSKLPIVVEWEKGIRRWSGMLELAVDMGYVIKPKNGWYTRPCVEDDKSWRAADSFEDSFWEPVFTKTDFAYAITAKFSLPSGANDKEDEVEETIDEDGVIETVKVVAVEDDGEPLDAGMPNH